MRNHIVDLVSDAAAETPDTLFMTGDLGYSVVEGIQERLGDRFVNAGVAEQNMVTMAGALALTGFRVYVYSIAPFVTLRCLEQLRNDVCHHGADVRVIGVGAGMSYGTLGPSHHSLEDATILGALPGMHVVCPANKAELGILFRELDTVRAPIYFRIGRESGRDDLIPRGLGLAHPAWIVRDGRDATAVCSGTVVEKALDAADDLAAEGISLRVVGVPVMTPFPHTTVAALLADGPVVSVVEAYPGNPLEVGVMETLLADGGPTIGGRRYRAVNVRHAFPEIVASHDVLRARSGLSRESVAAAVRAMLAG